MKTILFILATLLVLIVAIQAEENDKINALVTEFNQAPLLHMQIMIVTRSPIFGNIDTTVGDIRISNDSRYHAKFNDDIYLFDGECIWEFSAENNQATKDCLDPGEVYDNELLALKNLKQNYEFECLIPDSIYNFSKMSGKRASLPDSLIITMDREPGSLSLISYNDTNGDINDIIFLDYEFNEQIHAKEFQIALPDSAEIITLP